MEITSQPSWDTGMHIDGLGYADKSVKELAQGINACVEVDRKVAV